MSGDNTRVSLADAIENLRAELSEAQKKGAESDLKFNIKELEVELQIALEKEVNGGAGFNWSILSFNAGAKDTQANTHRVLLKMELAPDASGARQRISRSQR